MFISVTRLHLRNRRHIASFLWHTLKSYVQVKFTNGSMSVSLEKEDILTYWTLTTWKDPLSLRKFRNSGAHLQAMKKSREIADELEYIHWTDTGIPTWEEAKRRLHQKYDRT